MLHKLKSACSIRKSNSQPFTIFMYDNERDWIPSSLIHNIHEWQWTRLNPILTHSQYSYSRNMGSLSRQIPSSLLTCSWSSRAYIPISRTNSAWCWSACDNRDFTTTIVSGSVVQMFMAFARNTSPYCPLPDNNISNRKKLKQEIFVINTWGGVSLKTHKHTHPRGSLATVRECCW